MKHVVTIFLLIPLLLCGCSRKITNKEGLRTYWHVHEGKKVSSAELNKVLADLYYTIDTINKDEVSFHLAKEVDDDPLCWDWFIYNFRQGTIGDCGLACE